MTAHRLRERERVALIEGIRFAADSPLEEAVRSELVSGRPKFPVRRENTGNFIDFGLGRPNLPSKRRL
jgi:hypothetical protein